MSDKFAEEFTLAELCIVAAAEAWRDAGEVLATGIGLIPRLAASLAKSTFSDDLMMTDGEAYLVEDPVPVGPRNGYEPKIESWMSYARTFDNIYGGRRHAMVGPVQVDKYGQCNMGIIGDPKKPKAALLGVRGIPGNSINHTNSMFLPNHSTRSFVDGEVDMVGSVGYNPSRWPGGKKPEFFDINIIVTNLAVLDFLGPDNQMRVRSLHPGVAFDEVQDNTSFDLAKADGLGDTPAPTEDQLTMICDTLDPHDLRATALKDNPSGIRGA